MPFVNPVTSYCFLISRLVFFSFVSQSGNWIEYGFKQVKNELGWADFRLTDYPSIERWWELIMSAYLLVSIQANYFQLETVKANEIPHQGNFEENKPLEMFLLHPWWEAGTNWKSALNNLRLIIQPYIFYCLLHPWLEIFKIPRIKQDFRELTVLKQKSSPNKAQTSFISYEYVAILVQPLDKTIRYTCTKSF